MVRIRERAKSGELFFPCPPHCNGEGSSGSWARKSGEIVPTKPDSLLYKGAYIGYWAVGRRERGDDEVELFWDGVKSGSCAAPGEGCLSSDLWQMLPYAVLCLHGKREKKCLWFWLFPLFCLFNETEHKPYIRVQSMASACGNLVMLSLGTKFPLVWNRLRFCFNCSLFSVLPNLSAVSELYFCI